MFICSTNNPEEIKQLQDLLQQIARNIRTHYASVLPKWKGSLRQIIGISFIVDMHLKNAKIPVSSRTSLLLELSKINNSMKLSPKPSQDLTSWRPRSTYKRENSSRIKYRCEFCRDTGLCFYCNGTGRITSESPISPISSPALDLAINKLKPTLSLIDRGICPLCKGTGQCFCHKTYPPPTSLPPQAIKDDIEKQDTTSQSKKRDKMLKEIKNKKNKKNKN